MAFDKRGLEDYVDVAERIATFRDKYPDGSLQPADPAHPWEQAILNGVSKDGTPFAMTMIVYCAAAYRTPGDPRPGIGIAWEPFPGRTPYTLGSELMNAETSAWGRAIVAALAADTKRGVASAEEVALAQARQEEAPRPRTAHADAEHTRLRAGAAGRTAPEDAVKVHRGPARAAEDPWLDQPAGELPERKPGGITREQQRAMHAQFRRLKVAERDTRLLLTREIVGRPVPTSSVLSYEEAAKLLAELKGMEPA